MTSGRRRGPSPALREELLALGGGELAGVAGCECESGECERTDADAEQAERGVADGSGHAADLAVFAFGEFEGDPGVGDVFAETDRWIAWREIGRCIEKPGTAGERAVFAERDAAGGEAIDGIGARDAFDLSVVFARVRMAWVEKAIDEGAFVGEEEQAFAIGIEAADGIDARREAELGECAPCGAGLRGELREDAVGFVEGEEHAGEGAAGMRRFG
jgi:hypothetical protein